MRQTLMRTTILAAALLVTLAACGDDTGGTIDSSPAKTLDQLDGLTFVGDQVVGHPLVNGTTLRLSFKDGKVDAQAGCNQLSGTASVDGDTLVADAFVTTDMGCDQALMDQDTWLTSFLSARPTFSLADHLLTLSHDDTTVTLTDEAHVQAQSPIPLEGTTWELESLVTGSGDDGSVSSVPGDRIPTLRIEDGQAQVFTGCNQGRGQVEIATGTLTVSGLALTKMACPDSQLEEAVLAVLGGEAAYEQDYDTLTLTAADGSSGLVYKAQDR